MSLEYPYTDGADGDALPVTRNGRSREVFQSRDDHRERSA